jgi:hypothetical protein
MTNIHINFSSTPCLLARCVLSNRDSLTLSFIAFFPLFWADNSSINCALFMLHLHIYGNDFAVEYENKCNTNGKNSFVGEDGQVARTSVGKCPHFANMSRRSVYVLWQFNQAMDAVGRAEVHWKFVTNYIVSRAMRCVKNVKWSHCKSFQYVSMRVCANIYYFLDTRHCQRPNVLGAN